MKALLVLVVAVAASPLGGCFLDGSRLPDSERLTVDGPVLTTRVEAPAPSSSAPPLERKPPTGPIQLSDADVQQESRESPRELIAALSQQPPEATASTFARIIAVRAYGGPSAQETLRPAEEILDALEPDPPRWRAAISALSDSSSCVLDRDLVAAAGKMWARNEKLRPAALYLATSVFVRCHNQVGGSLRGEIGDLLHRFGAPLAPALLDALLAQFPRAFTLVPVLWPFVREGGALRRADAINAHVPALVSLAHGAAFCGLRPEGVGPFERCAKMEVRQDLLSYVDLLEAEHDTHGLGLLRATLRDLSRDPEIDGTVGDIVDRLDRRLAGSRGQ